MSFDVQPGEWLGVVGESGSGKSTLARIIARLETPTEGTVWLEDTDIGDRALGRKAFARRVQFMYQNSFSAMNPRLTIAEVVAEPLILHGLARGKAEREAMVVSLLRDVGLDPSIREKRPGELSGGQCQRAAIARALALEPEILLLDEPTSALDVSVQAQIIRLLRQIEQTRELTVVMISHDLALVSQTCHRICVLYRGDLVEIGPTENIVGKPQHPYTVTLLESVPTIPAVSDGR
ncbi:ABC transporter ATP-binding protein [Aeromicrobium sp. CTD01-1L150]|uniref:ABC transporter ATP-binding protein n=1 Tax=Aeromicrobium sp. CTD01-1L150 TaxID=3341830 RepID=UPI0035BED96F